MQEKCTKSEGISCCTNSLCILPHTKKCCWHEDTRENKGIMYVDGYGDVDVKYYGITVPIDLYYCPECKQTTETISGILEKLNKLMEEPEEYQKRKTMEVNTINRKIRDKVKSINALKEKKNQHQKEKELKEWQIWYAKKYGFPIPN